MARRRFAKSGPRPAYQQIAIGSLRTPVGTLVVATAAEVLLYVGWNRSQSRDPFDRWLRERLTTARPSPMWRTAAREMREYFCGRRRRFDVPVDLVGTEFQEKVWHVVAKIPFGETLSYGEIAAQVGEPEAGRAVGAAVGANPVAIVVPCHRVIGADGSLTGYGGGLRAKVWLLRHEGMLLA